MRYLTLSELTYINGRVVKNAQLLSGKQKVRDSALLEAAVARPQASAFGADAYPTLPEKVAALFHSIARNHPYTDGNKRTATVAAIFMFEVNGQSVAWQAAEALTIFIEVAEGRMDQPALAEWFPLYAIDPSPDPDSDKDMQTITRILETHRWLLDELAKR